MNNKPKYYHAEWNAPQQVKTLITTRIGGHSKPPYDSFNLATHVKDNPIAVRENRLLLLDSIPQEPFWLEQTHSDRVITVSHANFKDHSNDCDAAITSDSRLPLVVLTADCIPILLTDKTGSFVAAVHAGWKGVLNHITLNTLKLVSSNPEDILVFIGPYICHKDFEVSYDVVEEFIAVDKHYGEAFVEATNNKYLGNLTAILKQQLTGFGIPHANITESNLCTVCNNEIFFSYRKEGDTGRFASLIWIS